MTCFMCRVVATAHVVRGLRSQRGPGGWARICIPCAIRHNLNGVLLAPPSERSLVELWIAHRNERNSEA